MMSPCGSLYLKKKEDFVSRKPLILCNYLNNENKDPNFKSIYNNNLCKKMSYRVKSKNKKILINSNSSNLNLRKNGRKIKSFKHNKKKSSINKNLNSNKNFLKRINKFFLKIDVNKKKLKNFKEKKNKKIIKNQKVKKNEKKKNINSCDIYLNKIISHLIKKEKKQKKILKLTNNKLKFLQKYELYMLLIKIAQKHKIKEQTIFLTWQTLESYIMNKEEIKSDYTLELISMLFMFAKYEEIYPPEIIDFIKDYHLITKEDILNEEEKFINFLNFDFTIVTVLDFFFIFCDYFKFEKKVRYFGIYLLNICNLNFELQNLKKFEIAVSICYLLKKIFFLNIRFNEFKIQNEKFIFFDFKKSCDKIYFYQSSSHSQFVISKNNLKKISNKIFSFYTNYIELPKNHLYYKFKDQKYISVSKFIIKQSKSGKRRGF